MNGERGTRKGERGKVKGEGEKVIISYFAFASLRRNTTAKPPRALPRSDRFNPFGVSCTENDKEEKRNCPDRTFIHPPLIDSTSSGVLVRNIIKREGEGEGGIMSFAFAPMGRKYYCYITQGVALG